MNSTMKLFVLAVLAVCTVAQAAPFGKSPAITLLEYYKTHRDDSRIISGQPATKGQFPWQVSLKMFKPTSISNCGGSLISPRWVLTALATRFIAKIGIIHRYEDEPGSVTVSSTTGIAHEKYNKHFNNDIALIKLNQDVPLSETIQIIRLPTRSEVSDPLTDKKVTVSGWDRTSTNGVSSPDLNFVELDTITNERCSKVYGPFKIISSTICAVGHPEHSACKGDSGGPLVLYDNDRKPTLVGVVSFGTAGRCESGDPSVFVRTASYLDWINTHTGIAVRS